MIVLIGFMGAGKTTVGRLVAARLGLPFIDTDERIVQREGAEIVEIFERLGEPGFREIEREVVIETLAGHDAVVALGGGALEDPVIAAALQGKKVVHLDASWTEVQRRTRNDPSRPLLRRGDAKALFESRHAVYQMTRRWTVDTEGKSPEELSVELAILVAGARAADNQARRVVVDLADRSYEIIVSRELLGDVWDRLPPSPRAEKAFLIGHPSLERLIKEIAHGLTAQGIEVHTLTIEEGEASKSLAVVESLWERLASLEAHRNDLVVGVGGGVVCDVAGFVAGTYTRGMPLVQVPTTLLAQVDAAIGGKCGINIPAGKNLIGSIYQPMAVLCDVDVLASLPPEELRSGMAEVVKYGMIEDPELLDGLPDKALRIMDGDSRTTADVVARSAAIKAAFVAADEHDRGRRAFLNYGHTFAHAIERIGDFRKIRHGEAVALGMMAAAYVSHELGRLSEYGVAVHKRILDELGLPTTADLDLERLQEAWRHDKKHQEGIRFVLLNDLGRPEAGIAAPNAVLGRALDRMRS